MKEEIRKQFIREPDFRGMASKFPTKEELIEKIFELLTKWDMYPILEDVNRGRAEEIYNLMEADFKSREAEIQRKEREKIAQFIKSVSTQQLEECGFQASADMLNSIAFEIENNNKPATEGEIPF